MPRPYDLPPLSAMVCFEAAARFLSFKDAAAELNVTPAAISHQIKRLEIELGSPLFRRQHRGVELTETGAYLFIALQRGFEGISDAVRDIRSPSRAEDVLIQATTAVSSFWLTPQIMDYWRQRPDIVISQMISDVGSGTRADLSIHYGEMPEDDAQCVELFRDEVVAFGTPGFAESRGIKKLDDLLDVPLIHVVAEGADWTGWQDWFAALGRSAPTARAIVVNNYMIALQMARDGAGAVLGWTGLVKDLINEGTFVPLVAERMPSPFPFYLQTAPNASTNARAFRDWLVSRQGAG